MITLPLGLLVVLILAGIVVGLLIAGVFHQFVAERLLWWFITDFMRRK